MLTNVVWLVASLVMIVVGCMLFTSTGGFPMFGAFVMLGGMYSTAVCVIVSFLYEKKRAESDL